MFSAALCTTAKIQKQPKCSLMDEWIKKLWYIYIQWDIIQPLKKNKILLFVTTWMDLESIMLSEISQTEKNKYHIISFTCGRKKKRVYSYREQIVGCRRRGSGLVIK